MDKFKFWLYQHTGAYKSTADSRILPNFEPVQDCKPVPFTCKFHNNLIKINTLCPTRGQIWAFFGTEGQLHVTPKEKYRFGLNLNWSKSSYLSWLPAILMKVLFKMKALPCPQQFLHYTSMGKTFDSQWRVTPKLIDRTVRNSN